MTFNPDIFTFLPGGVKAGVLHMNVRDLVHHAVLADVLCSIVEHEAKAHDATFIPAHFNKIIEAVRDNKISAYFVITAWDNCRPKIAGGSIEFLTLITKWDGKKFQHYAALYGEDTSVFPDISKALRERTRGPFDNGIGLGTFFEQERIRRWTSNDYGDAPLGMPARGRVGEYSAHSSAMIGIMRKFGATLGTEQDGPVMEIDGLTATMKRKWKVPVAIMDIESESGVDPYPHIF